MPDRSSLKTSRLLILLAGAAGLMLASAPAFAADTERDETAALNRAEVRVEAPRLHVDRSRLNAPPGRVSASIAVRYDDLDLRSHRDALELRLRVRDAARDVCTHLAEAYPVYEAPGTSCYKTALQDAMVRANEAIDNAHFEDRGYGRYASND
jgi:UrcA family protein